MQAFLASSSKAVAGFIAVTILAYLAAHGFSANATLGEVVTALVNGLVGGAVIWLSPANK